LYFGPINGVSSLGAPTTTVDEKKIKATIDMFMKAFIIESFIDDWLNCQRCAT
jgi:hypothetical protein